MSEMPHQGTLTGRITIGEMNDNNGNQCFELVPFMRIYFYGLANIDRIGNVWADCGGVRNINTRNLDQIPWNLNCPLVHYQTAKI